MKQTGILFQTEMVKAIDQNLKTQTRRTSGLKKINENPNHWEFVKFDGDKAQFWNRHRGNGVEYAKSPYGLKGDVLWVRETFEIDEENGGYFYYAQHTKDVQDWFRWKPSIHMPKDAARIWLQIDEISLERIQDISEEDARAEGVDVFLKEAENPYYEIDHVLYRGDEKINATLFSRTPRDVFRQLIININGYETWHNNPWVWVIKFKRIEKP